MRKKRSVIIFYPMIFILFFCLNSFYSLSQGKKIVVLGSSTAATNNWWSWVNQYSSYLASLNAGHSIINLAQGGFGTWSVMPTGTGTGEDPARNITMALSLNPDIIIVNLPTNDAAGGIPLSTTMSRFRLFRDLANSAGISFWLTTSQGRGTGPARILVDTRDSINAQFGTNSIDFFTTIANPDGSLNVMYDAGDNIHVNQAGHDIFFQRVKEKPILGSSVLPLLFKSFRGNAIGSLHQLTWEVQTSSEKFKQEIQRSIDGVSFYNIGELSESTNSSFAYSDNNPLPSSNYYRIKLSTSSLVKYSGVIHMSGIDKVPEISVVPNPVSGSNFQVRIKNASNEKAFLIICNAVGTEVFHEVIVLNSGTLIQSYSLPPTISKGMYLLKFVLGARKFQQQIIVF
jgi:hypothetical protein